MKINFKQASKLILSLLVMVAFAPFAAADSCTIDTKKVKNTLDCLNLRLNQLEGLENSNEPVYQDDRIKITIKASRQATSNPVLFKSKISFVIKNVSGKTLLLGQNFMDYPVSISDNTGVNCRTKLDGWSAALRSDNSNNNSSYFTQLKANKSVVVGADDMYDCSFFKGNSFNVSIDFLEYDLSSGQTLSFTAAMTGIAAPLK